MDYSLGIIFPIIAMIGFGISNALGKIPSQKFPYQKTIFFRNLFSSLILCIALIFFLKNTVFDLNFIFVTLGVSIIGYLSLVFFYKALKIGKVGLVTPIANSSTIFTVGLSVIFFQDHLKANQAAAIIIIILGIILSSVNLKDLKNSHLFSISSGLPFALVTCVLWGFVFFFFKYPVQVIGPILTAFIIEFGGFIAAAVDVKISKIKLMPINNKDMLILFFVAFFASIGSLFFNLGIEKINVSLASAITNSSPLIAILFGWIFYKERLTKLQYLSISFIVIGIVFISW